MLKYATKFQVDIGLEGSSRLSSLWRNVEEKGGSGLRASDWKLGVVGDIEMCNQTFMRTDIEFKREENPQREGVRVSLIFQVM